LAQLCAFLPHYQESLIPVTDALLEWCETTRIPVDLTHGDFWLGNVLFSGDNVTGIIDWEWAQKDGFVLVDALHMLLMSTADANGGRVVHYLRQLWADEISDAALQERIVKLRIQSGMDKEDLKFIALLLWSGILWQKAMRGRVPSSQWLEDMIPRTIPAVTKWLTRLSTKREPHTA
jgi:thiamine kinase-like enzyme